MIFSYLTLEEWKSFSCASSICNAIAAPMLFRSLELSSQSDKKSTRDVAFMVKRLATRKGLAASVQTLEVSCSWQWTRELVDDFGHMLDNMAHSLSSLRVNIPYGENPAFAVELAPLAHMLHARRHQLNLREFGWDNYVSPSSLIFGFLGSQTNLKVLHAPRIHDIVRKIRGPEFALSLRDTTLSTLETINASTNFIMNVLIPHSPNIRHLRYTRGCWAEPIPWVAPTIESIKITKPPDTPGWEKSLSAACPNLRSLHMRDYEVRLGSAPLDLSLLTCLTTFIIDAGDLSSFEDLMEDNHLTYGPALKECIIGDPPLRWIRKDDK